MMTAQLEAMMARDNKEIYEAIKTLEKREAPKHADDEGEPVDEAMEG